MKTPKTYAAIDIGSNAVRLLIKKVIENPGEGVSPLEKQLLVRVPLRLGFDVFREGEISERRAENLVRLMKAYSQLMKIYRVDVMRACATSAMRDASNGKALIEKIASKTGIKVEIISGAEEAQIVYCNHIEAGGLPRGNYLYVDVGGGSTELNFLADNRLELSRSFNIGTVRLLTGSVKQKSIDALDELCAELADKWPGITIIGSGGNINKLYKMAGEANPGAKSLTVEELRRLYDKLSPLDPKEREARFGLRDDRADVIVPAATIFLRIADRTGAREILVPGIGVADGIIDGLYQGGERACLVK